MNFISFRYVFLLLLLAPLCYHASPRIRNVFLLVGSYVFYASFGLSCLPYLLASTLLVFVGARLIEGEALGQRKLWLVLSLLGNIGMLFLLKYANFFVGVLGETPLNLPTVSLILPVGISFFVFQTTGYLMDVYRGQLPAERNWVDFALFASFFPGLSSGPIQRAKDMLPQYKKKTPFSSDACKAGFLQFLWGAAKKMILADQLALFVNAAYADPAACSGTQLALAALAYSIQIYCDFSAYSDMAIGSAKMLGFTLMRNFNCPYFATSVQDFWHRWHISLSTWFRDYLYFPLGGSRVGKARAACNLMLVFLVSGLWHGAAFTFLVWGLLHGFFQVVGTLLRPARKRLLASLSIAQTNKLLHLFRCVFTFLLVTVAWVFFRAESVGKAWDILSRIVSDFVLGTPSLAGLTSLGLSGRTLCMLLCLTVLLFVVDWCNARFALAERLNGTFVPRYLLYFLLLIVILLFGCYGPGFDPQDFVYFKF